MGHMTLVAEEIVKLFSHYPTEIYSVVEPHLPQPAWNDYVTTLRETRERDGGPLGGGVVLAHPDDTTSTASGLSDEDDEYPLNSARVLRAMGKSAGGGAITLEAESGSPDQVCSSRLPASVSYLTPAVLCCPSSSRATLRPPSQMIDPTNLAVPTKMTTRTMAGGWAVPNLTR